MGSIGSDRAGSLDGLSAREVEVLRLVTTGTSNHEIAARLIISVRTVEAHVRTLLIKTGCSGATELLACARRHGLI